MKGVQIARAEPMQQPAKSDFKKSSSAVGGSENGKFKNLVKDAIDNSKKPTTEDQNPDDSLNTKEPVENAVDDALKQALIQNQMAKVVATETAPVVAVITPVESESSGQNKGITLVADSANVGKALTAESQTSQNIPIEAKQVVAMQNNDPPKTVIQTDKASTGTVKAEQQNIQENSTVKSKANLQGNVTQSNQAELVKDGRVQIATKVDAKPVVEQGNSKATSSEGNTEKANGETANKVVTQTNQKSAQDSTLKQQGQQEATTAKAKPEGEESKLNEVNMTVKSEKLDSAKVNIKVAEPYTANTENKMFTKQVADKIIFSGADGNKVIEIQLMPKDLGKITIKLMFEGNTALVQMTATNAKAQSILNLNAEGIKQIVETNTNTNVVIKVEDESKLNQQNQTFDGKGERQNKEQEKKKDSDALDPDSQIAFVNQLRLGLVEKSAS